MLIEETKKDHSGKIMGEQLCFQSCQSREKQALFPWQQAPVLLNTMFQVRCIVAQPQHSEVEDSPGQPGLHRGSISVSQDISLNGRIVANQSRRTCNVAPSSIPNKINETMVLVDGHLRILTLLKTVGHYESMRKPRYQKTKQSIL